MNPVAEALHLRVLQNQNPSGDDDDILSMFECSNAMSIDYSMYDWTANIGPCIHGRHHFDITLQSGRSDIEYELSESISLALESVQEEDELGTPE